MPEGPVPPFTEPTGPVVDDDAVLSAFARDEAAGHSPAFHVERPMLLVERMVAAALRIAPGPFSSAPTCLRTSPGPRSEWSRR